MMGRTSTLAMDGGGVNSHLRRRASPSELKFSAGNRFPRHILNSNSAQSLHTSWERDLLSSISRGVQYLPQCPIFPALLYKPPQCA